MPNNLFSPKKISGVIILHGVGLSHHGDFSIEFLCSEGGQSFMSSILIMNLSQPVSGPRHTAEHMLDSASYFNEAGDLEGAIVPV